MAEEAQAPRGFVIKWNPFHSERDRFKHDVNFLILGTLHAGLTHLKAEARKEEDELTAQMETTTGEDREYIGSMRQEIWDYVRDQERFLRNMALVALISRLAYCLNSLARVGERISPIDPRGYAGDNEFQRIWNEYEARFDIKFGPRHIQWIEPLRKARNLIVHSGGEANPLKPADKIDLLTPYEDRRDHSFSKRYPQMVCGTDFDAEVTITEDQLAKAVDKAVQLTGWISEELLTRQPRPNQLRKVPTFPKK